MSTQSDFLKLILPLRGEFADSWDVPINDNAQKTDVWAKSVNDEIAAARGNKSSLADFLGVAHNADGSIQPPPETVAARTSPVYGDKTAAGDDAVLRDRLAFVDYEVYRAREGAAALRDALAGRQLLAGNMIVDGAKDASGFPTWMSGSADRAQINGTSTALRLLINGYLCRLRTDQNVTISGADGTHYVYADFQADGVTTVDGDSVNGAAAEANGTTGLDTDGFPRIFVDATVTDWAAENVQPGDTLRLLDSGDKGDYVIAEVGPGGDASKLKIIGKFPQGGLSGINYLIKDPLGVTLGESATEPTTAGRLVIGEADFASGAVTAVRARHFKDTYVGNWIAVDMVNSPPAPDWVWNHNLGSLELEVSVQVSQSSNGASAVEPLAVVDFASTLAVGSGSLAVGSGTLEVGIGSLDAETGTLNVDKGSLAVSSGSLTGQPNLSGKPTLTGAPTLTGSAAPTNAVKVQWTKSQVRVKPTAAGSFYRGYDGTTYLGGYIRVVIRKRGQ